MIADASFSFSDSTTNIPDPNRNPNPDTNNFSITQTLDNIKGNAGDVSETEAEQEAIRLSEIEEENEILRTALRASDAALSRIQGERDEARLAEEALQGAMKARQWEVVRAAIQEEIDRTREYRGALRKWKEAINSMGSKNTESTSQGVIP